MIGPMNAEEIIRSNTFPYWNFHSNPFFTMTPMRPDLGVDRYPHYIDNALQNGYLGVPIGHVSRFQYGLDTFLTLTLTRQLQWWWWWCWWCRWCCLCLWLQLDVWWLIVADVVVVVCPRKGACISLFSWGLHILQVPLPISSPSPPLSLYLCLFCVPSSLFKVWVCGLLCVWVVAPWSLFPQVPHFSLSSVSWLSFFAWSPFWVWMRPQWIPW